jgi:DNA helicase-2/ATP-dependent DNA helicase PcrA
MVFDITPEREAFLNARGKIVLNACPGSGKTTCIIHKVDILEKECAEIYGNYAGIACLSFTNIAKDEIIQKYFETHKRNIAYPHVVSTIDSFINQYITLPFINLLRPNILRPKIVDQESMIDELISVKYLKNNVWHSTIPRPLNGYTTIDGRPLHRSYPPSSIWINSEGKYTFKGKLPDHRNVDPEHFQDYGRKLFKWKIEHGFITSLDSSFLALLILRKYPHIGEWISMRFPFIIVDEAQDNSEIQHAIFDKFVELGISNIELIGDPYQSLYEWRDAKPQLFTNKYVNQEWLGLPLSQNRRSVQRIIDCFSIVRNDATDEKITTFDVFDMEIPIVVYKYSSTNTTLIVDNFEQKCKESGFTSNHIVGRGSNLINKMLGNTTSINPWKESLPLIILKIIHLFDSNAGKESMNELRNIVVKLLYPAATYKELREFQEELKFDYSFNGRLYEMLLSLPRTSESIENWSIKVINVFTSHLNVDVTTDFVFKQRMTGFKMADLKKEQINCYFNKSASNNHNIPISTIHKVKGSTLDAILYFFDENSTGESVAFSNFKTSTTFPDEKQRMIYVACSRPKQLLAMAFPEKITDTQLKAKFGPDIEIICL